MQFTISFLIGLHIIFDFAFAKPIVGENIRQAFEGEFPSAVAIKKIHSATVQPEDALICTGTLISPLNVLTVAHCLEDITVSQVEIIVGSINIRSGTKHFPLWWVDYYRWANCSIEMKKYQMHDIAVIKLTVPVDSSIKPAQSTTVPNIFLYRENATAAGWGVRNNGMNPQILETVTLKILSLEECERKIEYACGVKTTLPQNILCSVGDPFALLINGDSGCPISVNNELAGIHKSTMPYPKLIVHPDKVNVHISVYSYKEFIEHVVSGGDIWF